jgi:hypothetical protein
VNARHDHRIFLISWFSIQVFRQLESRNKPGSTDKVRELEEALMKTRLECLDREKAAFRRAREKGEQALRHEREVMFSLKYS